MFRHRTRTLEHNLRIASLLSFVAGMVNVTGFISIHRLTTNVTGHFAFFVDEVFKLDFWQGFIYFLYIFFFFAGSFVSSIMVEFISRRNTPYVYVIPTITESLILLSIAFFGQLLIAKSTHLLAFSLLFAMGLQNSLVTKISNSTVRTTHLTGLFTDLGIELSQLFFYKNKKRKEKLYSLIRLRLTIICFFFLGGIAGGFLYTAIQLHTLAAASLILLFGALYSNLKLKVIQLKRQIR